MKRTKQKHSLAMRWFHWINFPILSIMVWSGLRIYWANDVYRIGWSGNTIIKFFPDTFYKAFNMEYHLADGMAFHFVFMWIFAINGIAYVFYTIRSGEWKHLVPNRRSLKEAWQVLLHDLHVSKYLPPQKKYNAAQKIAYTSIIVMGFGSLITGLAIYKPVQMGWLLPLLGDYDWARAEHFILTIGYVMFFIIHILQVIKAGWNNFGGMVRGFEVETFNPSTNGKDNVTKQENL